MPKLQGNIVFACQIFFIFILGVFVDICLDLVQKYEDCGFFLWYDGPMCDRSKQIIHGLLNDVKKKENEVVVNRRNVKCMFWMMMIS